ncbi:LuxR C-terminal-related transcriptional regulator [Vulcanococcus limneticus]|uniref:helix-turn-helix transcriptional regulator n=1 Tax=Vulcanococcus limneticus TaxID=2170428 RepID=UPI00398BC659
MDYTPLLEQLHRNTLESQALLRESRLVLCLGSRLTLTVISSNFARPGQVVGAGTTEAEGLVQVRRHRPDVLICSDQLEQGCGVALVLAVKQHDPEQRTLLIVGNPRRRARIRAAIRAGCEGICLESRLGLGDGAGAVRAVCNGGVYLDRELRSLFAHPELDGLHQDGPREDLSPRELAVLAQATDGHSNAEIASQLYVTAETVKTHMGRVMTKLGARNRTHAAALGIRLGLVE